MADEIIVNPAALEQVSAEIIELDEKIAAASGSAAMGKRAYTNTLISEHGSEFENFVNDVVQNVSQYSDDLPRLVALTASIEQAFSKTFGENIDKFLSEYVEANKSDTEKVSDDELEALMNQAKELRKRFGSLKSVLELFGHDISHIPEPKRLTGSRGPRGPRTLSKFDYYIDGQLRSKTQNSLSSIANTVLKDTELDSTKKLREWLVNQGLDLNNPPEEWTYTLPNGKVLMARKSEETDQFEGSDDDEEEETED